MRLTASWCDLCVLGINIFSALIFLFLHVDFHFYTCIYNVLHMDRISCCNVKKYWIKNIIFLVWNSRFGMIFYVLNFFRFGIPYSICGHAYSLDLGRIACTQAHSRITDIARRTPAVAGPCDERLIWECVWVCCTPQMNMYYFQGDYHCHHLHHYYYVAVLRQVIDLSVQTHCHIEYIISAPVVLLWW